MIIEKLNTFNSDLSLVSTTVDASVQEQLTAVREISKSISLSSNTTSKISLRIHEISKGMNEVSSNIQALNTDITHSNSNIRKIDQKTESSIKSLNELSLQVSSFKIS